MKILYRIYQLCVVAPLFLIATILTAVVTVVGCLLGNGHFWGYYPGRLWSQFTIRLLLLPIKVEGREHLDPNRSYVFVANHQGIFDIFLIYGFLNRNFKWMMKKSLRKLPFVGIACKYAHHIFVDRSGPSAVRETIDKAREILSEGMSLVVFPEGARTFTGSMGKFRRGAFVLADDLRLPVCPLTINGSFHVMPRMNDWSWADWHPLSLTIHPPIEPIGQGRANIEHLQLESYKAVMLSLDEKYRTPIENIDE